MLGLSQGFNFTVDLTEEIYFYQIKNVCLTTIPQPSRNEPRQRKFDQSLN